MLWGNGVTNNEAYVLGCWADILGAKAQQTTRLMSLDVGLTYWGQRPNNEAYVLRCRVTYWGQRPNKDNSVSSTLSNWTGCTTAVLLHLFAVCYIAVGVLFVSLLKISVTVLLLTLQ